MSPQNPRGSDLVMCPLCGESADRPLAEYGTQTWVCSPCRAERTGAIHLLFPAAAVATDIARRAGLSEPDGFSALVGLRTWAEGLRLVAESVARLAHTLTRPPDTEAVANALMGEADLGLEGDENVGMLVTGLPPATARRLAKVIPYVTGPELTGAEVRKLLEDLA